MSGSRPHLPQLWITSPDYKLMETLPFLTICPPKFWTLDLQHLQDYNVKHENKELYFCLISEPPVDESDRVSLPKQQNITPKIRSICLKTLYNFAREDVNRPLRSPHRKEKLIANSCLNLLTDGFICFEGQIDASVINSYKLVCSHCTELCSSTCVLFGKTWFLTSNMQGKSTIFPHWILVE